MKRRTKKVLALFVSALMLMSCVPFSALAAINTDPTIWDQNPTLAATYYGTVQLASETGKTASWSLENEDSCGGNIGDGPALPELQDLSSIKQGDVFSVAFWLQGVTQMSTMLAHIYYDNTVIAPAAVVTQKTGSRSFNFSLASVADAQAMAEADPNYTYSDISISKNEIWAMYNANTKLDPSDWLIDTKTNNQFIPAEYRDHTLQFDLMLKGESGDEVHGQEIPTYDWWMNPVDGDTSNGVYTDDAIIAVFNFIALEDSPSDFFTVPNIFTESLNAQCFEAIQLQGDYSLYGTEGNCADWFVGNGGAGRFKILDVGGANQTNQGTESFDVTYKDASGETISTESVEKGGKPATIPALPADSKTATTHTTYAWDTDPATATITAATTFTQVATTSDHAFTSEVTTPATCEAAGVTTYTCSDCGYSYTADVPAALGHNYGAWAHTEGTENASSTHSKTCSVCNDTQTEACNFTSEVTQQATATLPEITTYTCSVCGYQYTAQTAAALGHSHDYTDFAPDYTAAAYDADATYTHSKTCQTDDGSTCSAPTVTEACTFTKTATTPATCTAKGSETYTCSTCGGTYTVELPMLNHTYGDWTHTTGTADAASTHSKTCSACGDVVSEACSFTSEVTQQATLTLPEVTTYTCSVCGYQYTAETAAALKGVTIATTGTDKGNVTLNGKDVSAGDSTKFAVGDTYTLVATPSAGCEFVGWQQNGKLVSTETTFSSIAYANSTLTAVFIDTAVELNFVFLDMYNNVVSNQTVTSAADVVVPDNAPVPGYTFTGWSMTADDIHAATQSATITANYTKDTVNYTVTATGCTITTPDGTFTDTATVPYDTQVTITKEGATAWNVGETSVAFGDSYTFYVGSDITVTPETAPAEAKPVTSIISIDPGADPRQVFLATRSVPANCTFVQAGFVYGKNLTDSELTLDNVGSVGAGANAGTVKVLYMSSTSGDAQFSLAYGLSGKAGTIGVKSFVTYKDSNGALKSVYSDYAHYTYA